MDCNAGITIRTADMESMVTLSSSNVNVSSGNTELENSIVYSLSKQTSATHIIDSITATNTYQDGSATLYAKEIPSELTNIFDLFTNKDTDDGTFALSTQYVQEDQTIPKDESTFNIGTLSCDQSKSIEILNPTNSIYESTIEILTQNNYGEFFDQNEDFGVIFDASASNNNYIRALNSKFNTIDNSNPMFVEEHTEFNETYAMGQNPISYYTVDTSNGAIPLVNTLDLINQLDSNGYDVTSIGLDNFTIPDQGVYRIQRYDDVPVVQMIHALVGDASTPFLDSSILPFFNSTKGMDNSNNNLPEDNLTLNQFRSIFDLSTEVVAPYWKFSMTVGNNTLSGYALSQDMTNRSETSGIFSLDDSELQDNDVYMRDYVLGDHKLEFNNATLTILPETNGSQYNCDNGIFSLSNGRETLPENLIQDGEIKLNIHSIESRANVIRNTGDADEQLIAQVVYNDEDSKQGISSELNTNNYVKYLEQLVWKNPVYDIAYAVDNSASLNLCKESYNGEEDETTVINNVYSEDHIQFESITNAPENMFEVFKINTQKRLANVNGLRHNNTDEKVSSFITTVTLQNMKSLVDINQVIDSAKIHVALKDLDEISLTTHASSSGWTTSSLNNKLASSSTKAYGDDANIWPGLDQAQQLIRGDIPRIYYQYEFSTIQSGTTNISRLSDKVTVRWGETIAMTNSITIPQDSLTRTHIDSDKTHVIVAGSDYIKSGILTSSDIEVIKVTSVRKFNYEFDSRVRPFRELSIRTPDLIATTIYYTVKDKKTGEILNNSHLDLISLSPSSTLSPTTNFKSIVESINTENASDSLIFAGELDTSDLKELKVRLWGYNNIDNTPLELSTEHRVSGHYGIPTVMELITAYEGTANTVGDVNFSIESTYISDDTGDEEVAFLNDTDGYYVQLTSKYDNNYLVSYFTSNYTDIGLPGKTNIANSELFLTVNNNYANVTTWNTSSFYIEVIYEELDKSTTVLNIRNSGDNAIQCIISIPNFKFLNTQAFISRGNKDVYRNVRWIGDDYETSTETETFVAVNYTYTQTGTTYSGLFSPDTGIYVTKKELGVPAMDFDTITTLGKIIEFELLQDEISVNMVGPALNPLSPITRDVNNPVNINGLQFQYVDGSTVSRVLTVDRYRGFYGVQTNDQIYKIDRDQLTATFSVVSGGVTISQTFNVFTGDVKIVDNLRKNSDDTIVGSGTIGLKIEFAYSMLATDAQEIFHPGFDSPVPTDTTSYPIYTMGDQVSISITNERQPSFVDINITKTLKDYVIFEFSGANFNSTGGPLFINSSRLKLNNSNLDYDDVYYILSIQPYLTKVYKNDNYLGNPANNGDTEPNTVPENWGSAIINTTHDGMITNGFNISGWNIKLKPDITYNSSISYFVVTPPYQKFTQRANVICEQMPYDPSVNRIPNTAISYMPVVENNTYNPFLTREFTYIGEEPISDSIVFSSLKTNNVTVTHHNDRLPYLYSSDPIHEKRYFYVEGNIYTINLLLGLKDENAELTAKTSAYNTAQAYADTKRAEANADPTNADKEILAKEAETTALAAFNAIPAVQTNTLIMELFNGDANELLDLSNNSAYFSLAEALPSNSGVIMNLIQPTNPYTITGSEIFATNNNPLPPNIKIKIESFFFTGLTSANPLVLTNKFNLPTGDGQKVTLYTRKLFIDEATGAATIKVYKYIPLSNIGKGVDLAEQVDLLLYNTRYVKSIPLPLIPIPQSGVIQLSDRLNAIQKSSIPSSWTFDSDFNKLTHVCLVNLNKDSLAKIPPLLFSSRSNGLAKATYISKKSLFKCVNKVGMPIFEIDYAGNVKSDIVSVNKIVLNSREEAIPNKTLSNYSLLSMLGFMNNV